MSFAITPADSQLVVDLEVPAEAALTLDAVVMLAELTALRLAPCPVPAHE
jgi:hypothetical protein